MTKITEKRVKGVVKKLLDEVATYIDIYRVNPATFGYGESGHADTLLLIEGDFYAVECKKDENNSHTRPELKGTKSEAFQKKQFERVRAAGGQTLVIHSGNLDGLKTLLEGYTGVKLTTNINLE